MKYRAVAVLAAIAFAVVPSAARAQYQDEFKLTALHSPPNGNVSPYIGSLDNPSWTSTFDVFCVDDAHTITVGQVVNPVWVSSLTGDLSHTRLGSTSILNYAWSAFLASQMDWTVNSAHDGRDAITQNAIWALTSSLGVGGADQILLNNYAASTYGQTLGLTSGFWGALPTFALQGTNYDGWKEWSVITCDLDRNSQCAPQEFIYQSGPPNEIVPEPASLTLLATGLVGMFAAGRKRRRNTAA